MRALTAVLRRPGGSRRSGKFIAPLCLALVAASCSSADDDLAGGAGPQNATPAAVQELVVGHNKDPWIDASPGDKKRIPSYPLNADVCETLVKLAPSYEVQPSIASKWEFVGNNTFRFTLKGEPRFSDGQPVTAQDVKYSLDYTLQEPVTAGFEYLGPNSVKVVDDKTVDITPSRPNLRLVEQINHPTFTVVSAGSDPFKDVMGTKCTGPFKVSEYAPGERLVVVRNDNYWGEKPKLQKITFRFYPDDTTRMLALQNGEVDVVTTLPRAIISSVQGQPGVKLTESPVGAVTLMYVAQREASGTPRVLSDVRLRQAVSHSINQKEYVEGVLAGNAELVETVNPPRVLGSAAEMVKGIPYDPAVAGRLLDEAGWQAGPDGVRAKDGKPLALNIVFPQGQIELTTIEFIQAQLKKVGIVGNIQRLDPGAYRAALDNGTYDLDVSLPNQNDANPAFLMALRWYSKATGKNAKIISPGPGTEFERLIDQTTQATTQEELRRLSGEAMHQLVDVEASAIPLAGISRVLAHKNTVQGLEVHPSGTNQRWSTVFMAKG